MKSRYFFLTCSYFDLSLFGHALRARMFMFVCGYQGLLTFGDCSGVFSPVIHGLRSISFLSYQVENCFMKETGLPVQVVGLVWTPLLYSQVLK